MQVYVAGLAGLLGVVCLIAGVKGHGGEFFAAVTGLGTKTTPAPGGGETDAKTGGSKTDAKAAANAVRDAALNVAGRGPAPGGLTL